MASDRPPLATRRETPRCAVLTPRKTRFAARLSFRPLGLAAALQSAFAVPRSLAALAKEPNRVDMLQPRATSVARTLLLSAFARDAQSRECTRHDTRC